MKEKERIRKFLIATHGTLAKGIKSSLDIIIGPVENLFLIQAYTDDNNSIEDELRKILESIKDNEELVVFSDLLGGSITNQLLRCALKENVHIVSGFNLALVIDILLSDPESPVAAIIENSVENAREQMAYVNRLIEDNKGKESND